MSQPQRSTGLDKLDHPDSHDQPGLDKLHQPDSLSPTEPPSLLTVVRAQRKVVMVALVLAVACFWVMGPLGRWQAAAMAAVGILLALANHLAGERWLGRVVSSGEQPSRGSMTAAALVRLSVLIVVAVGIAVAFWPDGVALLLGLALFRLVALVMTTIPLLKELKKP